MRDAAVKFAFVLIGALVSVAPAAAEGDSTPVDEALRRMRAPPGFEVRLVAAEPDIVQPIAQCYDERGRLWVLECLEYPSGARRGAKPRDRIKILEDADGDGRAEIVKLFAEGFDLATGIEVGYGGVFLGQAPQLLFIPDRDRDDRPDGPPEVLLEGWGRHDTHELLNSFNWGPDGWLYGCHGVFTHSVVRGIRFSAAVWRYHPLTRDFEIFAEGTSNPWGFDFDEHGQGFLTACVIPHLFHMVPGGLYIRQAGRNANPYAYGELKEISDHLHYQTGRYHARNTDPEVYGGGHAHCGALVYLGDNFPAEYRGSIFMGNVHGNRINRDVFERRGSTYVGKHRPDLLAADDLRFRCVSLRTGPDGAVTILDWHDVQNCHNNDAAIWDRSNGRVYKLLYKGPDGSAYRPATVGDLAKLPSAELVKLLEHRNSWWQRTANRLLAERQDAAVYPRLRELALRHPDDSIRLQGLWALYASGGFNEEVAGDLLGSGSEWVRSWTVRFLGEADRVSGRALARLADLAARDPSPEVRRQIASTCQRLGESDVLPVLWNLAMQDADADDPVIPLLIWIALEPKVVTETERVARWFEEYGRRPLPARHLLPRALRRLAAEGTGGSLAAAMRILRSLSANAADAAPLIDALDAIAGELGGRRVDPPAGWREVYAELRSGKDQRVRRAAARLAIPFGDPEAFLEALGTASEETLPMRERIEAARLLALAEDPGLLPNLVKLFEGTQDAGLRRELLRALRKYPQSPVEQLLLERWGELPVELRVEARDVLAGRRPWATALLSAIETGKVPRDAIDAAAARRILAIGDAELSALLERAWGRVGEESSEEIGREADRLRRVLRTGTGSFARGAEFFEKRCGQCHSLYGKGHKVGPDLDGAARDDIEYLIRNLTDPNEVVGKDYYAVALRLKDGQIVQGILAGEDPKQVTLRREQAVLETFQRERIRQMIPSGKSMMPEGQTREMADDEVRDLFAYVIASPYLSRVQVSGPFRGAEEDLLEARLPPEQAQDPLSAPGVSWRRVDAGSWGEIDLRALEIGGNQDAAFIYAEVQSPAALATELHIGSDDALKVWVNGEVVHTYLGRRRMVRDQDRAPVALREGRNRILVKVVNRIPGRSALALRLLDPQRLLEPAAPGIPAGK